MHRHVTLIVHTPSVSQNNMADLNDLFLFGDDFDVILGILENEEELDETFTEAADEVSVINFCSYSKYNEKRCFGVVEAGHRSRLDRSSCLLFKKLLNYSCELNQQYLNLL